MCVDVLLTFDLEESLGNCLFHDSLTLSILFTQTNPSIFDAPQCAYHGGP